MAIRRRMKLLLWGCMSPGTSHVSATDSPTHSALCERSAGSNVPLALKSIQAATVPGPLHGIPGRV